MRTTIRHARLALFLSSLPLADVVAQERTMTLTGAGAIDVAGTSARDVREARLTLRTNADFDATLIGRGTSVLVSGTWERPAVGNVERIVLRTVAGESVRGTGTLTYADAARTTPRRLTLQWTARAGAHRLELAAPGADDDDAAGTWSAGDGTRVAANIDARALGTGQAQMQGVRGGDFTVVRARFGRGGDVVLDVDQPTRGEIRGRVRRVQGRRVEVAVSTVFGYKATGTLNVRLRSADQVARWEGSGSSERGPWSITFQGTGMPNDVPRPSGAADAAGFMDRVERGRGALIRGEELGLEIGQATVRLDRGRTGSIVLSARRERVTIEGRWLEAEGGRVQFEIRRINARDASGRLTLRREGASFASIEGDGRVDGQPFSFVFVVR